MSRRLRPFRTPLRFGASGFTMMETLVALIVITVGVFGLTMLIPAGTRTNTKAGQQTRGSELATAVVERLLATPYSDGDLLAGTHQDTTWPYPGGYYLTWVVEDNAPIQLCKRITVTVRWPRQTSNSLVRLVAVTPRANDENVTP